MPPARLSRPLFRHAGLAALLGFFALTLAACDATFPAAHSDSLLTRDVLEIKDTLNKNIEQQTAAHRRMESEISQISDSSKNDALQTSIDDLSKRIQEQNEEIVKLRQEVQAMATVPRAGTQPITSSPQPFPNSGGQPPAQQPGMTPGTNPPTTPPPGPNAAMQAYQGAYKAYQTGDYQAAREGFQTALGLNPDLNLKIDSTYWLAESEYKLNDKNGAYKDFFSIHKIKADHPKAWLGVERMADIERDLGNKPKAIDYYQLIIKENPTYANIARVRSKLANLKGAGGNAGAGNAGGDANAGGGDNTDGGAQPGPNVDVQQ